MNRKVNFIQTGSSFFAASLLASRSRLLLIFFLQPSFFPMRELWFNYDGINFPEKPCVGMFYGLFLKIFSSSHLVLYFVFSFIDLLAFKIKPNHRYTVSLDPCLALSLLATHPLSSFLFLRTECGIGISL